jgi:hypothetical protein
MDGAEVLIPVTLFISTAAMVFGVVYLRTRQNLAMIEKGMNPKEFANRPAPYKNLKWGLLLIGSGIGLLLAFFIDVFSLRHQTGAHNDENAAVYFALIAIGGGLGLFASYKMEKKWWDENRDKQ